MGSGEPLFQSTWRRQEICKFFLEGRCLEDARWVEGSQRSGRVSWGPAWKQPQFKGHVAPCWWLGVRGSRDLGPFGEAVLVRLLFGCKMPTKTRSRWWFQIFFIFTPTWGRFPFWLIFFQMGWNHQPEINSCIYGSLQMIQVVKVVKHAHMRMKRQRCQLAS